MVWTDPNIPSERTYNASYELCDNKFHSVRVQRRGSTVLITVDQHAIKTFSLTEDFSLTGKFYVGGIPGNCNGRKCFVIMKSEKCRERAVL